MRKFIDSEIKTATERMRFLMSLDKNPPYDDVGNAAEVNGANPTTLRTRLDEWCESNHDLISSIFSCDYANVDLWVNRIALQKDESVARCEVINAMNIDESLPDDTSKKLFITDLATACGGGDSQTSVDDCESGWTCAAYCNGNDPVAAVSLTKEGNRWSLKVRCFENQESKDIFSRLMREENCCSVNQTVNVMDEIGRVLENYGCYSHDDSDIMTVSKEFHPNAWNDILSSIVTAHGGSNEGSEWGPFECEVKYVVDRENENLTDTDTKWVYKSAFNIRNDTKMHSCLEKYKDRWIFVVYRDFSGTDKPHAEYKIIVYSLEEDDAEYGF